METFYSVENSEPGLRDWSEPLHVPHFATQDEAESWLATTGVAYPPSLRWRIVKTTREIID